MSSRLWLSTWNDLWLSYSAMCRETKPMQSISMWSSNILHGGLERQCSLQVFFCMTTHKVLLHCASRLSCFWMHFEQNMVKFNMFRATFKISNLRKILNLSQLWFRYLSFIYVISSTISQLSQSLLKTCWTKSDFTLEPHLSPSLWNENNFSDVNPDLFPNLTLSLAVDPSVFVTPIVNPDTFAKTKDVLRNPILVTLALVDPELDAWPMEVETPFAGKLDLQWFATTSLQQGFTE